MPFTLLKSNSRLEYRLYLSESEDQNQNVIYSGHKLAISESLLDEILNYRYELSTHRIYYLKYDVWLQKYPNQEPSNLMLDIWRVSNIESQTKDLYEVWQNLLNFLRTQNGNFRNIWIVKINI